jgi:rare lipoprotein A
LGWVKIVCAGLLACLAAVFVLGGEAEAEEVLASWYGPGFEGQTTASGAPYDPYGFTAAHKTLPLGTQLVVSYNGLSVPVTVNDRGPYVGAREIDLSQGAAQYLGLDAAGVDYVDYQYAGYDPAVDLYATGAFDPQSAVGVEQDTAEDQYGVEAFYGGYSGSYVAESAVVYETAAPEATVSEAEMSTQPEVVEPVGGVGGAGGYVAQPGDNLTVIAASLGTTVEDLVATNGISDPDLIYAGQTLYY